jgi:hypothetical protein
MIFIQELMVAEQSFIFFGFLVAGEEIESEFVLLSGFPDC